MVVRSSFFLLFLSENRPFFLHAAEGLRGLQFLKGRALLLFLLFSLSRAHAVASIETTFSLVFFFFFFFFFFVFFLIVVVDRRSGGWLKEKTKKKTKRGKREKKEPKRYMRRPKKKTTKRRATNFLLLNTRVVASRAKE